MVDAIETKSGGLIDFTLANTRFHGIQILLHIDQTANVKNGEDEATILLDVPECKEIIAILNQFIKIVEGIDFVYTSESVVNLLETPAIKKIIEDMNNKKVV